MTYFDSKIRFKGQESTDFQLVKIKTKWCYPAYDSQEKQSSCLKYYLDYTNQKPKPFLGIGIILAYGKIISSPNFFHKKVGFVFFTTGKNLFCCEEKDIVKVLASTI